MIEEKEYYCPLCEQSFDIPKRYVSPCCFSECDEVKDSSQNEKCRKCGKIHEADYIEIECPHCEHNGSNGRVSPGHWECMRSYIECANLKGK